MPKNKILIYLLSTTLVLPTLAIPTAHADEVPNDKISQSSTDTKSNTDDDKETVKDSNDKDKNKNTSKHKSTTQANKASNDNQLSQDDDDNTKDDVTNDHNKDDNLMDHIINDDMLKQSHFTQLFEPDKYEDSITLTSLIQNLFNLNSDISDYEQPESSSHNNEADNTSKESSQTQTEDNKDQPHQGNEQQDDNNKSSSSKNEHTKVDKENTQSSIDNNTNQVTTNDDKQQTDGSQDNQQHNNKTSNPEESDSTVTDSALDSILDEYSEDAKKTQQDYESKHKHHKTGTDNNISTSKNDNPQLPTKKELEHKETPIQSFEDHDNIRKSDIRSTTLFESLPNLSGGNDNSENFDVVDSKDTRSFIKSIAKDAHDVGQNDDIYASVMIAQAILESDSGRSALSKSPNYNLFGIKGAYQGQSVSFNTLEAGGNGMYSINAGFRKYPDTKASLQDYSNLIKKGIDGNPTIYKPTWKSDAPSYKDATSHLAKTYATDPNYAKKLNTLIKHYNLTQFDKKEMPNLSNYTSSIKDSDGSNHNFKAFQETTSSMPYPHGQCTWYVYNRMKQFDLSISGSLGDAHHWNDRAAQDGYHVSHTPKAHTAVVFEAGQNGADAQYGHVAFVEKVNRDGSIIISESNVKGLGVISYRIINADDAEALSYISGK
ncbi:amidase domain-containing protein [Staphylococcus simiae]|uniref:amidase domain-containing protein n=1 Tax=Staphylococcus simiae TaxID=308354 RepID=UPI001A96D26F|nr:amidase domain-containing protein [Staphylococcus simiae]MBO1199018.1 amidase domain-containing protein [Staphylococcus simiae]MBO1201286.1 amidase domain-containing protein [Staphylococcus simiae]MBO1203470.1 amidase domain-containing protein [Staphylococcus simiae]MBO1210998.1 amidase domain-containing protein [Staphylococcus simiae]MBO1229624.1 amidase domain-containing protein [Staphylococcus simiae]